MWNCCNPYSHKTSKRFSVLPTRQVDLSLGLRNALTKKVWKSVPYRDWATRQAQKGGRGGRETGKGGERQKTEGKGRERKEPKVPFSPTLFMDASLEGLHESEAEWYTSCLHATVASLMSHPDAWTEPHVPAQWTSIRLIFGECDPRSLTSVTEIFCG